MSTGAGSGRGKNAVAIPVYIDAANLAGNVQAINQVIRQQAVSAAVGGQQTATAAPNIRTMGGQMVSPSLMSGINPARFTFQQAARERTNEQIARINAQNARERQNQIQASRQAFAQRVMGFGVPAAIGLGGMAALGPALNIGFASMSGGPVGAGIAASSFAVGGTARLFIRLNTALVKFQNELVKASEGVQFVTDNYREQKTAFEAIRVFQGGIASFTRENTMEKWNKALLDNADTMTKLNMNYQVLRNMLSETVLSLGLFTTSLLGGPDRMTKNALTAIGQAPGRLFGSPVLTSAGGMLGGFLGGEAVSRSRRLRPSALAATEEQLRNLQEGLFNPSLTSPEQFFKQTQLRLLKPDVAREQRMHMIRVLEEQRDILRNMIKDERTVGVGDRASILWDMFQGARGLVNLTLR